MSNCREGSGIFQNTKVSMRKKVFSVLLSACVAVAMFSACGTQTENAQEETSEDLSEEQETLSGKEDVTLRIWAGEQDEEYLGVVAQNFIEEHASEANITIEYSPMEEGQCRSNLLGDILNGPDVYTTTDGDLQSIVAGGGASPVENPEEYEETNLPAAVEALTIDGTMYGYPITADNGYFLFYNKAYFSDSDIKSFDQMLKIAEKNKKKIAMDWSSGWYLYAFYGQTGMSVGLNDDGVTNFCDWNSTDNAITGLNVAEALLNIGKSDGFLNTDAWVDGFNDGSVIACVSGVWDEGAIRDALGDNYGAAMLPTYEVAGQQVQMACYFGYKMVGVNPYSENLEWAHAFAQYIASEENQLLRFQMCGQGPSNINVGQSDEVQNSAAIKAVLDQSEYSEPQRLGNNFWAATMEFGNNVGAGIVEDSLEEMVDKMVEGITAPSV